MTDKENSKIRYTRCILCKKHTHLWSSAWGDHIQKGWGNPSLFLEEDLIPCIIGKNQACIQAGTKGTLANQLLYIIYHRTVHVKNWEYLVSSSDSLPYG